MHQVQCTAVSVDSCCWRMRKPNGEEGESALLSRVLLFSLERKFRFLFLFNLPSPHSHISLVWFLTFAMKITLCDCPSLIKPRENFEIFHTDFYFLEQIKLEFMQFSKSVYPSWIKMVQKLDANCLWLWPEWPRLSEVGARQDPFAKAGDLAVPHVLSVSPSASLLSVTDMK